MNIPLFQQGFWAGKFSRYSFCESWRPLVSGISFPGHSFCNTLINSWFINHAPQSIRISWITPFNCAHFTCLKSWRHAPALTEPCCSVSLCLEIVVMWCNVVFILIQKNWFFQSFDMLRNYCIFLFCFLRSKGQKWMYFKFVFWLQGQGHKELSLVWLIFDSYLLAVFLILFFFFIDLTKGGL